ncbi:OprD family porin [Pseudomonas sp. URIL14HWK12:I5]|uniref:OprD family porin n=1 Tax=Pseudomonas sp. URIL14HWK12:I5 TaxID=1261630 RepID=UPI0009D8E62A|nr:OprD family porin [Pseudomonas sp. URIL14HWK12:I5]SMC97684.1 outer membrane porin, OprD family [Pseudomonas sp. URIL14HWK12:I5]
MRSRNYPPVTLALVIGLTTPAFAEDEGFLDGTQLQIINRNYYFSQDYRNGDFTRNPNTGERQSQHREWGHGIIANLQSGFTQGTVGLGLDVQGLVGLKLDGGNGTVGNGVGVPGIVSRSGSNFDGEPKDAYGKVGVALKARVRDTELRYGDVSPTSPVLHASDIRLLPQTLRGFMFNDHSLQGLSLQGGKLESSSDRNASNHRGDLGAVYAGRLKGANDVVYLGGDYRFNDQLNLRLHASRLDDVWNQQFFNVDYVQPLGDSLTLKTGLDYYRTRDSGQALAGKIDNDSWSVHAGVNAGGHGFKLSYTRIDGDTPFDYVWNTYDIQLDAASQVSDFNNPNERAWEARYDYNFAVLGLPGLSLTARYVRGSDIDGTRAGGAYSYYNGIEDGRHWERNLWVRYVVQGGPARNLSFNVMQATHRVGGGHTAEANVDELRVIVEYPLDISL